MCLFLPSSDRGGAEPTQDNFGCRVRTGLHNKNGVVGRSTQVASNGNKASNVAFVSWNNTEY